SLRSLRCNRLCVLCLLCLLSAEAAQSDNLKFGCGEDTPTMYDSDLAYIQHYGFSDLVRLASPGVLTILRSAGITSGHVLDLGCGDGTWLRTLGENGFSATGIDQSASLIEYSAKNAPAATLRVGSVFKVSLPRCDAITALGEVLSYRSGPGGSPHSFRGLFKRAYAALRPGGVLIFDVFVKGRR